ncbi:uncharacterized protein EV422DRAFT_567217 [Fimicolochytrium jonesii]|uniref:uncharacterized protein n=1 Tax=Fimicolochytrium jonesii TaxID=1396493 RepID=UPI0022FE4292|nr:uncharacterized protein EV422DRAFT_567217 [Fimicolochytrium jonesii]KAI8821481.1 hypothetical protein EV422DRAFT_567217 [Fimicolochytrium jonesii]
MTSTKELPGSPDHSSSPSTEQKPVLDASTAGGVGQEDTHDPPEAAGTATPPQPPTKPTPSEDTKPAPTPPTKKEKPVPIPPTLPQDPRDLHFSVRPYAGAAFGNISGPDSGQTGTPRRGRSRPTSGVGGQTGDERGHGAKPQKVEGKREATGAGEVNDAAVKRDSGNKGGIARPLPVPKPKPFTHAHGPSPPSKPRITTSNVFGRLPPPSIPRHCIRPAPNIPLPPLRTRKGCVGVCNLRRMGRSVNDDRMRAFGLTKAGTTAWESGRRVIVYPVENGQARYTHAEAVRHDPQPERVKPPVPPIHSEYAHSFAQVLQLDRTAWRNTQHPARNPPAFLQLNYAPGPPVPRPTRFGCNTEWGHDSFVTVQAAPQSTYFMPEKERLERTKFLEHGHQRTQALRRVPGIRLETETTT